MGFFWPSLLIGIGLLAFLYAAVQPWPEKKREPLPQPEFFSQGDRNRVIEECAKVADLRATVFGGEPTTPNERQIVEHIAKAIRALKWQSFS